MQRLVWVFAGCTYQIVGNPMWWLICLCFGNSGGSRISGKGVHMYKVVGFLFANFHSFFSWNNLASLRPNYYLFIGYLKLGTRKGVWANPLNLLWICQWVRCRILTTKESRVMIWPINYIFSFSWCPWLLVCCCWCIVLYFGVYCYCCSHFLGNWAPYIVGSESDCDCDPRGRKFDPGPVPYFLWSFSSFHCFM